MNNIFLCGFMGVGKTFKGKKLAISLQTEFIDLDDEIVKANSLTIPRIFEKFGEKGFRDIETEVLTDVCKRYDNAVISTGGGIFTREENAQIMREYGKTFYLHADFNICYNRIKDDKNRPIATEKSEKELHELFNFRHEIYKKNADFIIDANKNHTSVVQEIIENLR